MIIDNYALYVISAILATVSPGPAVILIMTNSFEFGIKKTLYSIIGNITGLLILSLVSISGIGIIIATSSILFFILKMLSGSYLIYLGYRMINNNSEINIIAKNKNKNKNFTLFKEAFFVAISNPKALIFLIALFPNFINYDKLIILQFLILISTLIFFSFSFLFMYSILAEKAYIYLSKGRYMKNYYNISGTLFILFGLFLVSLNMS